MSGTTTDPNDPALGHGSDEKPVPMNEKYLVLSKEERTKGFIRPYRDSYTHVGLKPNFPLKELTKKQKKLFGDIYVAYEKYPKGFQGSAIGRYWTQKDLDAKGCGQSTKMGRELSETYAREPRFYGSTYCAHCQMHRPVKEFIWDLDGEVLGS